MAASGSFNIHAERIVDGNAGTLTAVTLYDMGSSDTRTLKSTETLLIHDYMIVTEDAADVELVVDSAAAGKYLVDVKTAAGIPIRQSFRNPYICPKGVVPKFKGAGANKSMCVLQCTIREA